MTRGKHLKKKKKKTGNAKKGKKRKKIKEERGLFEKENLEDIVKRKGEI